MANTVEIVVTSSQKGDGFKSARDNMDKTEKKAGRLGSALSGVGKIAGGFLAASVISGGFNKLTGFLGDSIELAKEQAAVEAQLNAVIASTGGAAGITADEIKKMASGFQDITNFGDEATIASSNVLLTFTKIGSDVFPKAQKSILDMSAALGQDLQSSTIQVGKALNDPIKGVSALQRVGITFSDSQKDMIRTLQEGGDMAGAQGVILAELEKQFKGSAEAAVEADGGITQAENAMGDLQEQIGQKMIPIMAKFKQVQLAVVKAVVDKVLPAFERMRPTFDKLRPTFEAVAGVLGTVGAKFREFFNTLSTGFTEDEGTKIEGIALKLREFKDVFVKQVVPAVKKAIDNLKKLWEKIGPDVKKAFGTVSEIVVAAVDLVAIAIKRMVQVVSFIWERWGEEIMQGVRIVWGVISGVIQGALAVILGVVRTFTALLKGDWEGVWEGIKQILSGAWTAIAAILSGIWAGIKASLAAAWDAIKAVMVAAVEGLVVRVRQEWDALVSFVRGLGSRIASAASGMWNGFWEGFRGIINKIIGAWNSLEFTLPSIGGFGGQTVGVPDIPLLGGQSNAGPQSKDMRMAASGGIRSGLTMVGENGRELIDLAPGSRVMSNPDTERRMASLGGQGGPGVSVTLNVAGSVLSERDLIAVVRDELIHGGLADAFSGQGVVL